MFTIWLEKCNAGKKDVFSVAEKIRAEKALSDEFDKIVVGEKAGNKNDFATVVDFDVIDVSIGERKITLCGKNFRRMFFPKYTLQFQADGMVLCKKGIYITIVAPFLMCVLGYLAFVASAVYIALSAVLLIELAGLFYYNYAKAKEEMEEIDLLIVKVLK